VRYRQTKEVAEATSFNAKLKCLQTKEIGQMRRSLTEYINCLIWQHQLGRRRRCWERGQFSREMGLRLISGMARARRN